MTDGETIQLQKHRWVLGEQLDRGGMGRVFVVSSPDIEVNAVAKLVPKAPGADRELLFVDLADAQNVVPVIDSGEHGNAYVLLMERAECSLKQHLERNGPLSEQDAVVVLRDVVAALEALAGRVVHRDLKPGNVLFLHGHWCLADFGISRYAEATTADDTRKFSMTPPYAAPEQWRWEQATAATDIYALGIMAYEMLAGSRPFPGPSTDNYRHQHLHEVAPRLEEASGPMASLVAECLHKSPGSRPSPGDVARRLDSMGGAPALAGLASLQDAHHAAVSQRAEAESEMSRAETEKEQNARLFEDAQRSLTAIGDEVQNALIRAAPSIVPEPGRGGIWRLRLDGAELSLSTAHQYDPRRGGPLPFEVMAFADISLDARGINGYRGRSHSLWYCDAMEAQHFSWYELAFMQNPLVGGMTTIVPFALGPSEGAAAIAPGITTVQLAWNFRRLVPGELDEFIVRWGNWLARAYQGPWQHPNQVPEEQILQNWRGR